MKITALFGCGGYFLLPKLYPAIKNASAKLTICIYSDIVISITLIFQRVSRRKGANTYSEEFENRIPVSFSVAVNIDNNIVEQNPTKEPEYLAEKLVNLYEMIVDAFIECDDDIDYQEIENKKII